MLWALKNHLLSLPLEMFNLLNCKNTKKNKRAKPGMVKKHDFYL
jgi:hypothetical protein